MTKGDFIALGMLYVLTGAVFYFMRDGDVLRVLDFLLNHH